MYVSMNIYIYIYTYIYISQMYHTQPESAVPPQYFLDHGSRRGPGPDLVRDRALVHGHALAGALVYIYVCIHKEINVIPCTSTQDQCTTEQRDKLFLFSPSMSFQTVVSNATSRAIFDRAKRNITPEQLFRDQGKLER